MSIILRHSWLLIVIGLAGCGTFASSVRQTSTSTAVVVVGVSDSQSVQESTAIPTETSIPPTATVELTAIPTEEPTATVEPTEELASLAAIIEARDPEKGAELFQTYQATAGFACSTCHNANSEARLIGPGLLNVASRAETRVEGQSAIDYIYTSIVNPSEFVVPDFPDGLMPQNWAEVYSDDEIYDIIAYLLTLES